MLTGSNWRLINRAAPYAWVFPTDHPNAWSQLGLALAEDRPDAVVFAFGSNDVALAIANHQQLGLPVDETFAGQYTDELHKLRGHAAVHDVLSFIALTPPLTPEAGAESLKLVYELNHRVRNEFDPGIVIEFFSTIVVPDDFIDVVHLGPTGMTKRAQEAYRKLAP
jgi:hypothetical protein